MKLARFHSQGRNGFSLLEVMIAIGVFFIATFAILGVISNGIANARRLQRAPVDAGVLAAELSITNKLTEGKKTGNLGELLGKDYSQYNWTRQVEEVETNRLFRIDFSIQEQRSRDVVSQVTFLMYSPQSEAGSMDGGMHHQ
jgi:hypothetical protein